MGDILWIVGCFLILFGFYAFSTRCPSCGKFFVAERTGLSEQPNIWWWSSQVVHYRCKGCDHSWTRLNDGDDTY